MNYKETRQYIQAVQTGAAIQPGLETISLLLSKIGNPQDACSFIHLAGTNGKGSTGTFITNVLAQSGRKIGRYFSPALFRKTKQYNGIRVRKLTISRKRNTKPGMCGSEKPFVR